jgi:hypothetical protein
MRNRNHQQLSAPESPPPQQHQRLQQQHQNQHQQQQQFKSFDIVWYRYSKNSFWPATFFENDWLDELSAPENLSIKHVAVMFFGTYDKAYFVPSKEKLLAYREYTNAQLKRSKSFDVAVSQAFILQSEVEKGDKHIVPLFWEKRRNSPEVCSCCQKFAAAAEAKVCASCENTWHLNCFNARLGSDSCFICPDCEGREARRKEVLERCNSLLEQASMEKKQRNERDAKDEEEKEEQQQQQPPEEGEGYEQQQQQQQPSEEGEVYEEQQHESKQQQQLSWAQRMLASGRATGNIRFSSLCPGGFLTVCQTEGKGRGLFAASNFRRGDEITVAPADFDMLSASKSCGSEYMRVMFIAAFLVFPIIRESRSPKI